MTKAESRQQLNKMKQNIKNEVVRYNTHLKIHNKQFKDTRTKLDLVNA